MGFIISVIDYYAFYESARQSDCSEAITELKSFFPDTPRTHWKCNLLQTVAMGKCTILNVRNYSLAI